MEWIPIEDDTPDCSGVYPVTDGEGLSYAYFDCGYAYQFLFIFKFENDQWSKEVSRVHEITHWLRIDKININQE